MSDSMDPFDDQGPDAEPDGDGEIWLLEPDGDLSESGVSDLDEDNGIDADQEDQHFDDPLADDDLLGEDLDDTNRALEVGEQSSDRSGADSTDAGAAELEPTDTDLTETDGVELDAGVDQSVLFDDAQITGLLADLDIEIGAFDRTMVELQLHQEPDSRSVVVTLEQLEVESRVEHADVDRLAQLLAEGANVRMPNGDTLVGVDDRTDEAIVHRDGSERRIPLDRIESHWSSHAFEMVVTETVAGRVVLLPVAADPAPTNGGISG